MEVKISSSLIFKEITLKIYMFEIYVLSIFLIIFGNLNFQYNRFFIFLLKYFLIFNSRLAFFIFSVNNNNVS